MPLYTVSHSSPLTDTQKDALAAGITQIHCTTFTVLSPLVNVRFEDLSTTRCYVGGKLTKPNSITAHVRHNATRTRASYTQLCTSINTLWEQTVVGTKLDTFYVLGALVASSEHGFLIPEAGADREWVRENLELFKENGERGNGWAVQMVVEAGRRGFLNE